MLTNISASPIVADGRWHDGGPPAGAIVLAAIVLVAIIAAVTAAVLAWSKRAQSTGVGSAKEIVAERFARGEIDAEEYRSRLSDLDAT